MFEQFILSLVIISHLSNSSQASAFLQSKEFFLVPTIIETSSAQQPVSEKLEWHLQKKIRTKALPPKKISNDTNPHIFSRTALVLDADTKEILWQKNPQVVQPIASITKLLNALVWLDHQGSDNSYTLTSKDDTPDGKDMNLPVGTQLSINDILHAALIASYNDAANALAHSSSLSDEEYLQAMNRKAQAIGMQNGQFVDFHGLSWQDTASAQDVALLAQSAFSQPEILKAATTPAYAITALNSDLKLHAYTTDQLLFDKDFDIIGGKTGYTEEAGYCLTVKAKEPKSNRTIIGVILGADTDEARFTEMKKLLNWTFQNYTWN